MQDGSIPPVKPVKTRRQGPSVGTALTYSVLSLLAVVFWAFGAVLPWLGLYYIVQNL
jgi:hypothetical protein